MLQTLPKLPYSYDALEPFIDEATMKLHHDKHHQTYTDKFNEALDKHPELKFSNAEELLKNSKLDYIILRPNYVYEIGKNNYFYKITKLISRFNIILKRTRPKTPLIKVEMTKNFRIFCCKTSINHKI